MSKEQDVINYYVLCNKLKNVIRTGWLDWKVQKNRLESIAEHIYGVQMLAIAMKSVYQYDIDDYENEYWYARKLSKVLEYKDWRNFLKVLNKAREACKNSGFKI